MAEIELTPTLLVVHVSGVDRLLAMKIRLEVPLAHVAEVTAIVPEAHAAYHGLRMGGTNLPGVITAGRFVEHGEWAFWDVHNPDSAIAIRLHDDQYAKLVIGVDDPQGTVAAIKAAVLSQA